MKERRKRRATTACGAVIVWASMVIGARAERIDFLGPFVNGELVSQVPQGVPFSLLARLSANNQIPLFGYSLNVDVSPNPGATGSVSGLPDMSNFYEQQNLITQGGGMLHPVLSIIINPGDGGLFVNGVNHLPIPVNLSQPGVNDILAELVFTSTEDTLGFFLFDLGPGSVLSHVPKFELEFETLPKKVEIVVPEPASLAGALALFLLVRRRRGVFDKHSRANAASVTS